MRAAPELPLSHLSAFTKNGTFAASLLALGMGRRRRSPEVGHPEEADTRQAADGLGEVQMAGRLGLTLAEYRALETGELHITNDLYERIVDLCGWPRDS